MPLRHRDHTGTIRIELRRLARILFSWRSCLMSKLVLLLGSTYLFVPIDLIPDRLPFLGHLDEVSFVALGFIGARRLVPIDLLQAGGIDSGPTGWQDVQFLVRILRADLANFFLLHYRGVDGFLVTGKNSGTHWLRFMLSHAIAEQYGVAPPTRSSGGESDRIIGNPRWPRNRQVPWIGSSHTIPSIAFAWRWFNWLLPHPPVVVLVRDINAAMQSNYIKWRDRYGGTISAYVRGDPNGRRYVADIWWYMHFFNRWGKLARAQGDNVLVVRYEELLTAPAQWLRRIASHYNITLEEPAITAALQHVDRDAIRERLDPGDEAIVVPSSGIAAALSFVPEDIAFIRVAMQRHLRWDFGYGYTLPGGV